jgi:glucokinase
MDWIMPNLQQTKTFVLAFDIGGTKIAIATASEDRTILERVEFSTINCGDGPAVLNQAILFGQGLVQKTKEKGGGRLVGVGVATIGITTSNGVELAPNIPEWENLKIESTFTEAFPGVLVRIENDVKAAALAELRRGALKNKDFGIYVNFGTGVSLAYTFGDRVLKGHNGASGEIAYFLRDKNEHEGFLDGVAPFEEFAGGKAIGKRASEQLGVNMTTKELFQRAEVNDSAKEFIEEVLKEIAFHLTNVIISWDPETVVFGGGFATGNDLVIRTIEKRVKQFVPYPPDLVVAQFDKEAGLYGAIELVI